MFLSRRYFHDIRLRKNFRRKFQNCKRKQRKKKKKNNNNNVETSRIKRRGQEDLPFFFFSREIQLKLRCVCNGERKKVKKKRKKGERSEVTFLSFFTFFFFFRGKYRARYTDTACSCAKLQPAMLRSYIMHTRVYIHGVTRDVLKPLYTSVTDKLQRIYMPQAPGLAAATMGKGGGQGKTIFHVLKRRELRQTWWIKTAARREFRYEKLWREARKKYRVNLFEKSL